MAKHSKKQVKLRDVLRIVHPVGKTPEQGEIFAKLIKDELATPKTWETVLSANGQLPANERKTNAEVWTDLIESNSVQYMALLRNLRNIIEANVPDTVIKQVMGKLVDEDQIKKSKQLPFRFVNALTAIDGAQGKNVNKDRLRAAVRDACNTSLTNIPSIGNNIWIILDVSGSMEGTPLQTGALFSAALVGANKNATNVKVTIFSNSAEHINVDPKANMFANVEAIEARSYGGGTNLQAALDLKPALGFEPDTVILFSDMQVNQLSSKREATKIFGSNVVKVAFNLNAYASTPVSEIDGWYQLAGFSERAFDFIPAMRNKTSVVKTLSVPYKGLKGIRQGFNQNDSDEE